MLILFIKSCREHAELNYYTTEQVVALRKELGRFIQQGNPNTLRKVSPV